MLVFLCGANVHLELLVTAILRGLEFLVCPTRGDVVALVNVDVILVLEEDQSAVCTSESIVVPEEVTFCHSRLLLSLCTLIITYMFPVVNSVL